MLGGGGTAYAIFNLIVQLTALVLLAVHHDRVWHFVRHAPLGLRLLVGLSVILPLIQVVPLPPALWQSLPGRELVAETYMLAGLPAGQWMPVSVDVMRSFVAFCGTLAPAAVIAVGSTLRREELLPLCWVLPGAAIAAFLLGALQLSSAGAMGQIYEGRMEGNVLYATFANRNSTGLFFVLTAILVAALPLSANPQVLILRIGAFVALAAGVVLTQSRSSMALLLLAAAFAGARLLALRWPGLKIGWLAGAGALIAVILAVAVVTQSSGRMADSLDRFSDLSSDRPEMWEDGLYAAERYWPIGAGMGSFDEVFQIDESLEHVSPRRAGRAHNDYIELGIEAGLPGFAVLAGWLALIGWAVLRPGALAGEWRWMRAGAGLGLTCIAAQSVLDYPLRNQTLLCVAALLVVVLAYRERDVR